MEHSYWLNLQKRALLGLHQGPSSRTNNDVVTYMAFIWHHILGPAQEEKKMLIKWRPNFLGKTQSSIISLFNISKNISCRMRIIALNVEGEGLDILTWALCCSVLLVRSDWHKIKLLIYFHLLLETYNIKTKFHDHFFLTCFIMRFFVQICELFRIHVTFHSLYFCVIWSSCKRIWVVHCLIILHWTSFLCIAWYLPCTTILCLRTKTFIFYKWRLKGDYMKRWIQKGSNLEWSFRV